MARITRRGLAGLGLAAPFLARHAWAQGSYPDRPVRMIVPYSAGGVADTIARIIQPKVAEHLGQSFIIENRTGASGSIGAMAVAQSPALARLPMARPVLRISAISWANCCN